MADAVPIETASLLSHATGSRGTGATLIVLDHQHSKTDTTSGEDDAYYRQFEVPDDLIW